MDRLEAKSAIRLVRCMLLWYLYPRTEALLRLFRRYAQYNDEADGKQIHTVAQHAKVKMLLRKQRSFFPRGQKDPLDTSGFIDYLRPNNMLA